MTRIRTLAIISASLAALLFVGCPTDGRRDTFEYLRSPVTFRMDPVPADHPFCLDASKRLPGSSEEQCRTASKYRLRWDRPEDTVGFEAYRIYVDTTHPNSTLPWSGVRKERSLASFVLEGTPPSADSIIFVLADSGSNPDLSRDSPSVVALDTTGRLDSSGRLIFAIVTSYRGGGLEGQPRYTWVITDDRFAPYPPQPRFTAKARSIDLEWERPGDPTSFFEPEADSGIILAYYLRVVRGGKIYPGRPGTFDNVNVASYTSGGVDRTAEVDSTHFFTLHGAPGRLFRLPDSSRVRNRNASDPLDSLRVTIAGLSPQDTVNIGFWAVDVAGNVRQVDSLAFTRIFLTDTTQPTTPLLSILDSSRNGFIYVFTASRDLVPSGGGLVPAAEPNTNILEYRVTRRRIGGPAAGAAIFDTVITVRPEQRGNTLFTDTVRYLAPGTSYRLLVRAVDSSGHVSGVDSLPVSTLSSRFSGIDSNATCPPGFIAIPGGRFMLGDTSAASATDEKPAVMRVIQPYCIEPYEHRDSTGAFAVRKTWQQAHDICRDLASSMTPADSTWLCTEAEWERACEGAEPDVPLVYGIQSEKRSPGSVRFACNIGTGDSAMALSSALRDPSCISYEGAFDMAGNLAEWVLDPVTLQGSTNTIAPYPATDTLLRRGTPHTPVTASSVRGFRGSHYLNPNQSPQVLLARARCSNRDFATQSRPRPLAGCIDSTGPQIVVTYNNAALPPRCLPLPPGVSSAQIDTVTPARDSSQILILLKGVATPVVYQMPFDTVYNVAGVRPIDVRRTRQTLAIVTFRNSETAQTIQDTLNATELLNASQATLDAVFLREAAPPWSVVKVGGVYEIRFLHAHVQTRNVPAKAYHSNTALGFRCCSRPRPGN
jgi:formylglycine-generating enzyme required for sulfatase activity